MLARWCCGLLIGLLALPLQAAIVAKDVEYEAGGTRMIGYLAYDDSIQGLRPGVLVVHEWWGLNDYARSRARQLAELGYTAFAVDMFGDGRQAEHPDEAGVLAREVNSRWNDAKDRFSAALELLRQHETTDATQTAAIGYCFGGGIVLNMAREGFDLKGVVSFHGFLSGHTRATPDKVRAKVLVLHGEDDSFIPGEDIIAFKQEMDAAGIDYRFIAYPGAVHGFTNPGADRFGADFGLPLAYNPEADRASWSEMQGFFERIFGR
jgi:dienelactone hydrolase